ncbi:MAG: hypothetical protein ABIG90_01540 [bacterium]
MRNLFWHRIFLWLWVALMFFFFVILMQMAHGRVYDYERQTLLARERRLGRETDEFRPIGGKAEITDSAIFENGICLESFEENAMAVAIYQFKEIDKNVSSLAIQIAYRGTGKVFVVQEQDTGITFELPADQERQTLYLAANYIADGIVEIHVIADSNRKLDIRFVELESLRYKPEVRVITQYAYLPIKEPTVYYYYYRGPIYSSVRPYEYIVYDGWWHSDWYIGWHAAFRVRTYPVYRYHWRPDRVVHIRHYHDDRMPVIVRELPRSREQVQYTGTQRRRPEASRGRVDITRPKASYQPQPVIKTSVSRVRIVQPERKTAPAQKASSSSSRTVIKQRRESAPSAPAKTDDDEEESRKKRRR